MGQTIIEKVFSRKVGRTVAAGDLVVAPVDFLMGHDANAPGGIVVLQRAGLSVGIDRKKIALVIDHHVPCTNSTHATQHAAIRNFAQENDIPLYDIGSGIGHILMVEQGHALPGQIAIAVDSHATTCGAVNAAGVGVGSTEMAALMATGKLWFKVPKSMRVNFTGRLQPGVFSKDVILQLVAMLGEAGANYHSVEYAGEALAHMSMDARFTICNMSTDMGAKTALMEVDDVARAWLAGRSKAPWEAAYADVDATYSRQINFDASALVPQLAAPHRVDNAIPVTQALGTPINQASIGTCTNGYMEDIRIAASMLKGKRVAKGVRLYVVPGTREIYRQAMREGLLEILFEAGAMILQANCTPCSRGVGHAIPGDGEVVLTTANRNFRGRLGNKNASIYLGSPATVAASAVAGVITDPREQL